MLHSVQHDKLFYNPLSGEAKERAVQGSADGVSGTFDQIMNALTPHIINFAG